MEYIDKNKSRKWAHALIKEFLRRCLDEDGVYPNDLYEAFRVDSNRKDSLVKRLLDDNNNRCCYCMRNINGTTIEHMIPQSVKIQGEFSKYYENESLLDVFNMILAQDFIENPKEVPPYPHTIAYENLIPSCFGNLPYGKAKCCNNHRKNKTIQPLVFRLNIHDEVKYKANGDIIWTEDPEPMIPTLTTIGLDCIELKAIRRIWYYLASQGMGCEDANREKTIYALLTELNSQEKEMEQMLSNFTKSEYWELLEKYTYFNNIEIFE